MPSVRGAIEWLGWKSAIVIAITAVCVLYSLYLYFVLGTETHANYWMTAAVLVGAFAFLGTGYHREHVDGCSMGMGQCIRKIVRQELKDDYLKNTG